MRDDKTLAFINLYGMLGNLVWLCELDEESRKLVANKKIALGITVKNGPAATLCFDHGRCTLVRELVSCDIKLAFSSCAKFNGMIDGTVTPIPRKGFTKLSFLTKDFIALTNRLEHFLRPAEGALEDKQFFQISTLLMFHLIAEAVSQIGNQDKVGRISAGNTMDGVIKLGVAGGPAVGIKAKNHQLSTLHEAPAECLSYMEFESLELARALFDGQVNALSCVGAGQIRIGGMISQVDNINRILDRVSLYLA